MGEHLGHVVAWTKAELFQRCLQGQSPSARHSRANDLQSQSLSLSFRSQRLCIARFPETLVPRVRSTKQGRAAGDG
jgi:hypothetical protein